MRLEQMIQVMKAYHEKKLVIERREIGFNKWREITTPDWDWSSYEYRVKNTKFLPEDKVVFKDLESTPITKQQILKVRGYTYEGKLKLTDGSRTIDVDEETFININDCLWYWEYYTPNYKNFHTTLKRATIKEIEKEYKDFEVTPLYQLGFKLPRK